MSTIDRMDCTSTPGASKLQEAIRSTAKETHVAASLFSTAHRTAFGAGKLALALAAAFVALVALLHVVRLDLPPWSHVLSEYALGPTGSIMAWAFFALAGSFAALLAALWQQLVGWRGVLAQLMLVIAALGAVMGGLFPMDPVGTPPEKAS